MELVAKYQQQLLEQAQFIYYETPISEATVEAFRAVPRHRFIPRYRTWGTAEWHEVNEETLESHLPTLYADRALILFGEDDNNVPSTISQPSFVLRMLDLLQVQPGNSVFELGAGSGWNAALLGHLVGEKGCVYSLEIIPDVARRAAASVASLDIQNVHIIAGDGGAGYAPGAPYDRAIFTAGAYDLPGHFYEQIKEGGLLLIVIKNPGGGDYLFLLRKEAGHFESEYALLCGFVQFTGKYQLDHLEPTPVERLPKWKTLQHEEVNRRPFYWGGIGKRGLIWRTAGIRSFLSITEPSFRPFITAEGEQPAREELYFGLWDQEQRSLVLAKDDYLIAYGNLVAQERLLHRVRQWVDLGMPSAASFKLQVYPATVPLKATGNQWLVKRNESQFLWSLPSR